MAAKKSDKRTAPTSHFGSAAPAPGESSEGDEQLSRPVGGERLLPFDAELAELEAVVRQLEEGQLGLEDSLQQYERGVAALRRCHQRLAEAERRVELVSGAGRDGQPEVEPFAEPGMSLAEKAARRDQRRSRSGGGSPPPVDEADIDETDRLF